MEEKSFSKGVHLNNPKIFPLAKHLSEEGLGKLPWWTWIVPLPIFFIGTLISLEARITIGTSLFYFPLPFALTLVYWWGPRILPAYYLNAVGCAGLWGLEKISLWPIYGLPEVVFVFLSWLIFIKLVDGKIWLPSTRSAIYFLIGGILIPLTIYKFLLESVFVLAGDAPVDKYWNLLITTGFGDFISTFCVSIPLLHFLTRHMARRGLVIGPKELEYNTWLSRLQWLEVVGIGAIAFVINFFLDFTDYWFLNGILSLYIAIRFGFGATILINSYILIITYVIPVATHSDFSPQHFLDSNMLKTQLGTALLYIFTIITGRLVSDMRITERKLSEQNTKLNLINLELDRFVYSVSHDLSAPLKSILGLVNISRLTTRESEHRIHFNLIEKSVHKLETFVNEVLDYSRNKKSDEIFECINLQGLFSEILDNFKFIEGANGTKVYYDITSTYIYTDRVRLEIILTNIISNAIKFRLKGVDNFIKISTHEVQDKLLISIEDNGEGIRPALQSRVFDMFFRGTENSTGSGLGLYIAKEAARKINAEISVQSKFGKGSVFRIEFDLKKIIY